MARPVSTARSPAAGGTELRCRVSAAERAAIETAAAAAGYPFDELPDYLRTMALVGGDVATVGAPAIVASRQRWVLRCGCHSVEFPAPANNREIPGIDLQYWLASYATESEVQNKCGVCGYPVGLAAVGARE